MIAKEPKDSIKSTNLFLSLGNREIGKQNQSIFIKYMRKQVAQYSLTVGSTADFIKLKKSETSTRKNKGFKTHLSFTNTLRKINKSLCSCGRDMHIMNDNKEVDLKEVDDKRHLKGLKSCGNNSACPVCASKLSSIRGNQLKELMDAGRKNDRSYMMVVSTIPHKPLEPLEVTLNQVIDMSRYIFNSRQWKEFKLLTKCRFVHGGLENMVSLKNGSIDWHPHKNYLLDFDISLASVVDALGLSSDVELRMYVSKMMTKLGQRYLDRNKINKSLLTPYFESVGNKIHIKAGVSASVEFDDGYIAKWGLDAEMTAGIYKDGSISGSMHPFNLLDLIWNGNEEVSKEDKHKFTMAFQEFVVASRGKWWFYFARGSVAYYNENYGTQLKVKKDEDELKAIEDMGDILFTFTLDEWTLFKPTPKKIAKALTLPTVQDILTYFYTEVANNRIKIE